jgi:hypothetical protein
VAFLAAPISPAAPLPVIFLAALTVALVIFFSIAFAGFGCIIVRCPVGQTQWSVLQCGGHTGVACAALTEYRVIVKIDANSTAAAMANNICLCIKSCVIGTKIKVFYMKLYMYELNIST